MTDIVERLRYTANIRAIHRSDDDPIKRDCIEAAAEIERMRAALEEAAKECRVQLPLGDDEFTKGYRLACEENERNIRALMKEKRDG